MPTDPLSNAGRELLKVILQKPEVIKSWNQLHPKAFTYPPYAAIANEISLRSKTVNISELISALEEPVQIVARQLLVEPIAADESALELYGQSIFARVQELALTGEIATVKSELSRVNPESDFESYNQLFSQLMALEAKRREALALIMGS